MYRDLFNEIQEIAHEINALKNLYGITKIGFALDTSVSKKYNVTSQDDTNTEAFIIFRIQAYIATLMSEMVNGPKNFIVQYDESSAW